MSANNDEEPQAAQDTNEAAPQRDDSAAPKSSDEPSTEDERTGEGTGARAGSYS